MSESDWGFMPDTVTFAKASADELFGCDCATIPAMLIMPGRVPGQQDCVLVPITELRARCEAITHGEVITQDIGAVLETARDILAGLDEIGRAQA